MCMYIYTHTHTHLLYNTYFYIYIYIFIHKILHIDLWVLWSVLAMRQMFTCADFYFIYKTHVNGEIEEKFCSAAFCFTETLKLQVLVCLYDLRQKFKSFVPEFQLTKVPTKEGCCENAFMRFWGSSFLPRYLILMWLRDSLKDNTLFLRREHLTFKLQ